MIGIIGAMDKEVEGLKAVMTDMALENIAGIDFTKGKINGTECVVARCNPGKVNAAACAQIMIMKYEPKMLVNTGVAGGIGKNVHIGDVVIGTSCVQHDVDTSPLGDPVALIPGINIINVPCDEVISELIKEEAKKVYEGQVMSGVIATGDQFIADGKKCLELNASFEAMACEMESGSIAHVCYINKVPCAIIRSISDNANDEGSVDYLTFVDYSSKKASELLINVINKLDNIEV